MGLDEGVIVIPNHCGDGGSRGDFGGGPRIPKGGGLHVFEGKKPRGNAVVQQFTSRNVRDGGCKRQWVR